MPIPCVENPAVYVYPERFPPRDVYAACLACRSCELRDRCLATALEAEGDSSDKARATIRGGLLPAERAALRVMPSCEMCGRPVKDIRAKTCGRRSCRLARQAAYMREYQRTHRNNGQPNPIATHGTSHRANRGCSCAACSNRRRQDRRMARLRAEVREAS